MAYKSKEGINPKGMWDDIKFPLTGQNIDTSIGRIDYNYFNGGVDFQNNARYPEEPISMLCQLPHKWKQETGIIPHIHWLQQSANIPNFLLAYKIKENGDADIIETDYSNYSLLTLANHAFAYTSGILRQISGFGQMDMTGITSVSTMIHFILFRDTTNVSGQFGGVDPSALTELVNEFDVHIQIDALGSRQEYIK